MIQTIFWHKVKETFTNMNLIIKTETDIKMHFENNIFFFWKRLNTLLYKKKKKLLQQ